MSNMWMILHVLKILGHSFHTMSYALWASVKKLVATLLGRLTCHPMREQNCLGGKIFRAG